MSSTQFEQREVEQSGEPEWGIGRVLKSKVFGRRRTTLVVMPLVV